jgi:stage II sporulation protein D
VVNDVDLEAYVRGVVPNEVPASWPRATLRAQAVAARSYALATARRDSGFDHYDDTRSQVYVGVGAEHPATTRATRKSERQVVKHEGKVVPAYFFSSSGGRTESVRYGFPGSSQQPYLRAVRDPWDEGSPYHRWRLTLTRAELQSRLSGLVRGRLRDVEVLRRGDSPRIVRARIVGSAGNTRISGSDLRARLGLRSTWVSFRKIR